MKVKIAVVISITILLIIFLAFSCTENIESDQVEGTTINVEDNVKTYTTTDESTGVTEETTYTTSGGTTIDENGTEWRAFTSVSLMDSEDTAICDAIAKSYFWGEISLDECKASLLVYQEKYKVDYQTTEFGAVWANEGYNSDVFSNYVCIYTASQTTKTVDTGIEKYAVQF